ncbi:phytanoyl-CoA dioxygenase family protein [Roseobacter sp.]|uniref:phytanoyl-CoA dioxygenase family protein n=1 Tax=Roseobacter sp. TaxID=1907202 RepID=UPI003858C0D8
MQLDRYGVLEGKPDDTALDTMDEEVRLLGFTTLDAGLTETKLDQLSDLFDRAASTYRVRAAEQGLDLKSIAENDTIRLLPKEEPAFWEIVFNKNLHVLLNKLLGGYYILNQVNGLINRGNGSEYHQSKYHRDLPYQHFTSSRPLAINALFALDPFTLENGATRVIPASHHREAFPPGTLVSRNEKQVTVPRGTFIVLDCMVYHAGSSNRSKRDRRAINHVFTIPLIRQQLHLPSTLGEEVEFTESQRRTLGYGLEEYRSVDEWLASRAGMAS